jgi:FkbM family methyltransferase
MSSCVFTNDDNVEIFLPAHEFSPVFALRDNHEVLFRRIHTFLLKKGVLRRNIVDLGAWIGDNSLPWAKNSQGLVYAIDPSEKNCRFIQELCEVNNVLNLKTIQKAISNRKEALSTNYDLTHATFCAGTHNRNVVHAVSLDDLLETKTIEDIGYIHLDVEGMEFKVLQGASHLLDTCRPIISFEQHLEIEDYSVILNYLNGKNYKVFLIDEVLPGCRPDCRNSLAFPRELYSDSLIDEIHAHLGAHILLPKN